MRVKKKKKQTVNPQPDSIFPVIRNHAKVRKRIITAGRPSFVSMTTSDLGQQTHLHFHSREMLYKSADERQEVPMGSEDRLARVKSC